MTSKAIKFTDEDGRAFDLEFSGAEAFNSFLMRSGFGFIVGEAAGAITAVSEYQALVVSDLGLA